MSSYIIKPEPLDEVLGALGTKRDWVQEPTNVLTMDTTWGLTSGNDMKALRVKTGFHTINCSLNTRVMADRLLVLLSGARGAGKDVDSKRSHYMRRDWDPLYQCPILCISDPAMEKYWGGDLPRAGLYLGTPEHDMVPEVNALIDKVCVELGIDPARVVVMGASSGGLSSFLVATRRKVCRAVGVCAQVYPDKFRKLIGAAMQAAGMTAEDFVTLSAQQPHRTNPLAAIQYGVEQGNDVRVVFAQNTHDPATMAKHFNKMCQRMSINPNTGGISSDGTVMALVYDDWEGGHGYESKPFSRPLWARCNEFFETGR